MVKGLFIDLWCRDIIVLDLALISWDGNRRRWCISVKGWKMQQRTMISLLLQLKLSMSQWKWRVIHVFLYVYFHFSSFVASHFGEAYFGFDFILGMKLISSYFFLETSFLDSGVVIGRFSNDYRKTKNQSNYKASHKRKLATSFSQP